MENRYTITEASKQVGVETHVLRYWEEELAINIGRNELGHRFYVEQDIKVLKEVKALKDKGIQLKAIKEVVEKLYGNDTKFDAFTDFGSERNIDACDDSSNGMANTKVVAGKNNVIDFKTGQLQSLLTKMIGNAIKENMEPITQSITEVAVGRMSDMIDERFRENEKREEERYRKLDQTIRMIQQERKNKAEEEKQANTNSSKNEFSEEVAASLWNEPYVVDRKNVKKHGIHLFSKKKK